MSLLNGITAAGNEASSLASDFMQADARRQIAPLLSSAAPATAPPPSQPPVAPPESDNAAHGNALDADTVARAHAVYTGLVQRGMDPSTALGFAANAVQESRANPATNPGDMGASHGLMQWRGDRLDEYQRVFGNTPEKGDLNQQLDFIVHEISGPQANAWKAIQAAGTDPASRAAAVSQFYERPKDTAAEIQRRAYIADQLAGHFARMGNS